MTDSFDPNEAVPIPDYPNYFVDRNGTVWSRPRAGNAKNWTKMKLSLVSGYLAFQARSGTPSKSRWRWVHTAVLRAFKGPPPPGRSQCCHRNGNLRDNRLENLYWGDDADQVQDRIRHGTITRGHRAGRSRLTEDYVRDLRRRKLAEEEININREAAIHEVSYQTIWAILAGKTWKHIVASPEPPKPVVHPNEHELAGEKVDYSPVDRLMELWLQLTDIERREFLSRAAVEIQPT